MSLNTDRCNYCGKVIPREGVILGRKTVYCSDDCRKAFGIVGSRLRQRRYHDKRNKYKKVTSSYYAMTLVTMCERTHNMFKFEDWVRTEFDGNVTPEEISRIVEVLTHDFKK